MSTLVIQATATAPDGTTATGSVSVDVLDSPAAPPLQFLSADSPLHIAERSRQRWNQVR